MPIAPATTPPPSCWRAERPRARTLARPPVGETLLELDAVTRRFPGALTRPGCAAPRRQSRSMVSGFAVRRGEAIGILGGAGAGKSVLLRLIAGLGRAQSGQLGASPASAYRGSDLPHEAQVRMAMVLPNPHTAFNPDLPVGLTLTEPLRVEEQLLIDEQADGLAEAVRLVGASSPISSIACRRPSHRRSCSASRSPVRWSAAPA